MVEKKEIIEQTLDRVRELELVNIRIIGKWILSICSKQNIICTRKRKILLHRLTFIAATIITSYNFNHLKLH